MNSTEWWNTPENPDEKALDRRKHQLWAMECGAHCRIDRPDLDDEGIEKLVRDWLLQPHMSGYFLNNEQIQHLIEHGYVEGKPIALTIGRGFLIDDNSVSMRPPLIVEFMGYKDEW